MPSAAYTPIAARQGETLSSLVFSLTNPDGTPYDLTACTAHLSARASLADVSPLADLTDANGGLVIAATTGTITLVALAATTAAWTPGIYQFDLFVMFADGSRECVAYGPFYVIAANTRNP